MPAQVLAPPPAPEMPPEVPNAKVVTPANVPAIIVGLVIAAIATLSIYYLVQGEVDATRFDIAARVDGRVGEVPVSRWSH